MKHKPTPQTREINKPEEPEIGPDGLPTLDKIQKVLDMRQSKDNDMNRLILIIEECYDFRRAIKRRLKKETDPEVVEFKKRVIDLLNK